MISSALGAGKASATVISEATAEAAGKAATEGAKPLSGNAYKVRLVQTAVKRAVLRAAQA